MGSYWCVKRSKGDGLTLEQGGAVRQSVGWKDPKEEEDQAGGRGLRMDSRCEVPLVGPSLRFRHGRQPEGLDQEREKGKIPSEGWNGHTELRHRGEGERRLFVCFLLCLEGKATERDLSTHWLTLQMFAAAAG